MRADDLRPLIGLTLACGAAFLLSSAWSSGRSVGVNQELAAPVIDLQVVTPEQVLVTLTSETGAEIRYTLDGSEPNTRSELYTEPFIPATDVHTARLIATPTSVQWRHPLGSFPSGVVVRACSFDDRGRSGRIALRTLVPEHSELPVFALTIPEGALFDPDTGIYVLGNAIFRTSEEFVRRYPRDQKWWKYPGNFHLRGGDAERTGHVECFAPNAEPGSSPRWTSDVDLRINGNNTRGFPQHAFRVIFDKSLDEPLFGEDHGTGFKRVLLRTAGNDQDHAFFRDALQHRSCAELPFETSACVPSVLYVNGAYWGLHNLRERIDAKELARRHDLKVKEITIIEDRIALYDGDEKEVQGFSRFLTMSERWDPRSKGFVDSLERHMDVHGFLSYMAAQIILANTDWPEQNVKWWRCAAGMDSVRGWRDGRWRFIMGDCDLGLGLATTAEYDMFAHIDRHPNAPVARLFKACMRSSVLHKEFSGILEALLSGPLSAASLEVELVHMRDALANEMPTHIRRWRRPLTMGAWENHVEALLTFARQRPAAVRKHAEAHAFGRP